MQTLAVIWQSFGPYHAARLEGARSGLRCSNWEVAGIEVATSDHYNWKDTWEPPTDGFESVFRDRRYEDLGRREIKGALARKLEELDPDAVAVNGWARPEAVAALSWCKLGKRPAILMSETHEASGNPFKEALKRLRVRGVAGALVGGSWHADYLECLGVSRRVVSFGYDAVDNLHFERGAERARKRQKALRAEKNLPEEYFFACARLDRRKNIDGLLGAFREIARETEWDLVIAGSGSESGNLRQLCRELGLSDRVHWLGEVSYRDLPIYYGLAGAFVHIPHREAWGLVVNEAAAAGLPLIVGNTVGAGCELVREGETGWLVSASHETSVVRAMKKLTACSEGKRDSLGREARRVVGDFGPARFGAGLLDCLNRITN
jgi:hypothetical protein